ncbi:Asp-tRNA(Asn)/Glu-tRNA(Gln) amidotransferase subunit GatB [Helicobacter baculiformis]|uniref:Aspartyl/glutamyl-tRNA(Asn/Gln) amidotransferase subunit B n=1 Tax=Helicobacter baculiformis TaxID=427351 RepID=A0A1M4NHN0_9HELI|nr:Asp-tRNA(Asn)/Glu-tRNA(Gln) amidotransferase subunit GatB [Helicobacter baculiformis]SFZ71501.1 OMP908 [Helicobacter baculiformis]
MFETIIGLEVHTQLNTQTKIFCSCPTSFKDTPNSNTCPVCLGLPGALPVLNEQALKKAIAFGTAINATINQDSVFARKNYFYPDLPKAYQISQFEIPIVSAGYLDIDTDTGVKRVGIERAHLEEDAGKNIHEGEFSKVDLNRAGTPLLEIVSRPDLRSAQEAISYLKKLHALVRFLGISDANMQEGNFRCDANVSIRPKGEDKLYTRVEIKNLNSFKFIQKAIDYEVGRQIEAFERGTYAKEVVQETRLFDTIKGITQAMRDKEGSADYRYFPDPDLRRVYIPEAFLKQAQNIPELPDAKKVRYIELGLKPEDASMLVSDVAIARYFEDMVEMGASVKGSMSWLCVELLGRLGGQELEHCVVQAQTLGTLVQRIDSKKISGKAGKEILDALLSQSASQPSDVDTLIEKLGLAQVQDTQELSRAIDTLLAQHPDKVAEYKGGKVKLLGFFVGQVLKNLKGADPSALNALLKEKLEG